MSLITRCPACTTMFKVVPDQLRVSDGWVRCGQCSEVFDANAHLQADASLTPTQSSSAMAAVDVPPQPAPTPTPLAQEPVALPAMTKAKPKSAPVPVSEPVAEPLAPEPFLAVNPRALHLEEPQSAAAEVPAASSLRDLRINPDDVPLRRQPDAPAKSSTKVAKPPKHSFMRTPSAAPSAWTRPAIRAVLSLVALLLAVGLVLQVVVQERDRIVATEPSTKPYLERVCGLLACTLAPLRQIESVVIDSSAFTKVRTDVYRLSFALKNTAPIGVATPDVELTLTDIQDQAVVRKVFTAAEFGKQQQAVLEAGTELTAMLPVAVKLPADSEHIAGYRLLSFYP